MLNLPKLGLGLSVLSKTTPDKWRDAKNATIMQPSARPLREPSDAG